MPGEMEYCRPGSGFWVTSRGCGFHRVARMSRANGSHWEINIWDVTTEELVYHFSKPEGSPFDDGAVQIGTEPECDGYSVTCDTSYGCPQPPHLECLGPCYWGCLPPGVFSCLDMCPDNLGGQGGVGGAQ
jgi:hypothetical protein